MYKTVSILSALIRQFYLPNPYEIYFNSSAYADIFNIIIGGAILIQYLCNTFSNLQIQNIIIFAFIVNVVLFMLFRGIKNKISYSSVFV